MAVKSLVSVEEYLHTSYDPDCDYVDGEIEERNLGEKDHGRVQFRILMFFGIREGQLGVTVYPEQRVQVSPTRFRVPDVCLLLGAGPDEQIFTKPPFLAIEILSPEDRVSKIEDRVADYLKFGVPYVWLIDPQERRAWIYTADGRREVKDGILRTDNPIIELPLEEVLPARC